MRATLNASSVSSCRFVAHNRQRPFDWGSDMRKLFFGLGVVFAVIIGAGAVGLFTLARSGGALDAESAAYVRDSVVTIAGDWNVEELWNRSSLRFRKASTKQDLRNFFDVAKGSLGRLLEYRGATGEARIDISPAGQTTTARYDAKATFEKGDADIVVNAVKVGSDWHIEGFHINSTTFMRALVGTRS
jgi:hypothetical protein